MKAFLASLVCAAALPACAVEAAVMERPMCDPCAPKVRAKALLPAPPLAEGAALRVQVAAKLRAPFEAAAVDGWLTRERAAESGLGFIAQHFGEMDREGRGAIRFDDYLRFLKARGAALD
jgi:hypothetical protein